MKHLYFLLTILFYSQTLGLPKDGGADLASILSHVTKLGSDVLSIKNELQATRDELEASRIQLQATKAQLNTTMSDLQATTSALQHSATEITSLRNELALKTRDVSFHVFWSGGKTGTGPIKFTQVHRNAGNGYNSSTGYFTAPVTGTYIFLVEVHMYGSNMAGSFYILGSNHVVSESIGSLWSSDNHLTVPITAIEHVKQGDQVWVKCGLDVNLQGPLDSHFSGALLSAD